ncbi:hypothetical protein [Millionella massiliensis]|uniref:hypothetical protein n=1 Tax=Millionella massiliensis TaxID=1871023 RepID=UPI0008DAB4A3|nr:hypothetical protein [Millionella massiliensis]
MKHILPNIAVLLSALILATGCNKLKLYTVDKGEVLATVGEHELYANDIASLIEPGQPLEDSLAALQSIVDTWVRKEIKTAAAEAAISGHGHDIEEMVAQYRSALLTYKYEQEWLNDRLDTTVTTAQINEYYEANRNVFRLAGPIVKARIARIPAGLRQSRKLEEMFRSTKEEDRNDFQNICQKNQYRTDDFSTEWTDFSTVIRHIPFSQSNFDEFLRSRSYYEVEDDQYKYMMAIDAFRPTGDYSPMERETENIRKIILNKRRQSLLTQLEDSLYTTARNNQQFEIKIKQ